MEYGVGFRNAKDVDFDVSVAIRQKKLREVQKDTTLVEVEDDPVSDLAAGE